MSGPRSHSKHSWLLIRFLVSGSILASLLKSTLEDKTDNNNLKRVTIFCFYNETFDAVTSDQYFRDDLYHVITLRMFMVGSMQNKTLADASKWQSWITYIKLHETIFSEWASSSIIICIKFYMIAASVSLCPRVLILTPF